MGKGATVAVERPHIASRLAAEKAKYMAMLERLGARLTETMDSEVCKYSATPSRDWARVFKCYQQGLNDLASEQLKHAQLQLLAQRSATGALTDEDYELGLAELGIEAVKTLERGTLQKALAERGLRVEPVSDTDEDEA